MNPPASAPDAHDPDRQDLIWDLTGMLFRILR